jgi:NAD(P)-dependent dehydrogenase (short-subunit alcohol dehydrogenase family)
MQLKGKVALVTGAGRRDGIGWASAIALAEQGCDVVVTSYARSPVSSELDLGRVSDLAAETRTTDEAAAELEELAAQIRGMGRKSRAFALDVRDAAAVQSVVDASSTEFGSLDILFNNAGFAYGAGSILDLTEDQLRQSFEINVYGIFNMCRAMLPHMGEGGRIINNASVAGIKALPGLPAYSASKFAVVGLTQALAMELGPLGILCNSICPGAIQTHLGEREYAFTAAVMGGTREQAIQHIIEGIPLGRLGQARDVADVVTFLAGPASRYITGVAVPVAGGQYF